MVYPPVRPLAAAALLLFIPAIAALPGRAATILEKSVDVEIQPDGSTVERTALRVRVDTQADFTAWSPYAVYFDERRTIENLAASVTEPDGKAVRLGADGFKTVDLAGEKKLRSSSRARVVTFPAVSPGSVLGIEFTAKQRLDFQADGISLAAEKAPIERLRVAVRGGGKGWRWRIAGSRAGLSVQESADGVVVTGASLPVWKKEGFAPGDRSRGPILRYAWSEEATWTQVGQWYEGLAGPAAPISEGDEAVRNASLKVTAGRQDRRGRLASLLGFVRGKLRYVAAESGIDGHRPTPPQEVMERGWGDCKDKALLLIALLRESGIDAWPALIRLGSGDRIDAEFPSPFQFNHVIVAVAAQGVAGADDPVAGGYLFVDPTQEGSSIRWLHPSVQDQDALVVRGTGSALVRTPLRQDLEGGTIETRLTLTDEGDAEGEVSFRISGDAGATFASAFQGSPAQEVEPAVRQIFGQLLPPGAQLSQVKWTFADTEVPSVTLSARVRLTALAQGEGASHSFGLPPTPGTPKPAVLQGRELPVVLTPKSNRFSWRIEIPEGWCPPRPEMVEVGNAVGTFRQAVEPNGRIVEIGRELEIRQRWIEPARFADLEALAVADHRANQQLIRMDCGAAATAATR